MANGSLGDHPVTDVVVHGYSVFGREIDSLIRELDRHGYWQNQLAALYLLDLQDRANKAGLLVPVPKGTTVRNSRTPDPKVGIEVELSNLPFTLDYELARLRRTGS